MSDRELPSWVGAAVLGRVWELVAARLERESLVPRGGVVVRDLSRDERHAMTDLLGRSVVKDVTRVDLSALDDRLRSRAGLGLAAVASAALGRDLADLPALRAREADERATPFVVAREWLDSHGVATGRAGSHWVDEWLDGLRRDGMLVRVPGPSQVIVMALEVLAARDVLDDPGGGSHEAGARDDSAAGATPVAYVARTELAAAVTGSAHGLDDSERLGGIVLRALGARLGVALPRSADDRRRLWESARVVTDRVSSTCLVWGVAGEGDSGAGRLDVGDAPTHLTWWDLTAGLEFARGQRVLVCENPRTLEAIAEVGVDGIGVVCAMGRPALVVLEVLTRLRAAGAGLRYHGDFDWAGVAMANALVESHGVQPWLMSAGDYLAGHGSIALGGVAVEPTWDAELGAAMRTRGVAVHEEAVLSGVVAGAAAWGAAAR